MYNNLIDVITSKKEVDSKGIYFIENEIQEEYLSYRELYTLSWQLKEQLREHGIMPGTEIILQYEENQSFLIAFWACILGRMIPVPQAVQKGKESVEHVLKIYHQLKNPLIITNQSRMEEILQYAKEQKIGPIHFFIHTKLFKDREIKDYPITCDPKDIAFLQFSSGSTGEPKGIQVSHLNLIENFNGMVKSSEIQLTDSILSWMPLYHNLGLVVSHMLGIVCELDSYLMKTELFVYHPYLWMEKISEHRVTLSCSPNFGYRYYLRSIMNRDCSKLDLSCLRIILNGAEPISIKACNTFLEMMKPYGLRENVFQTGYGLAEATVSVTSTYVGRFLENVVISAENQKVGEPVQFLTSETDNTYALELVKVGRPHYNIQIRTVDEEGRQLADDFFGEIQVKGPIVSCGYYEGLNQDHKMEIQDGWLSTGDIGFLHKGQLVISGRKKDIIFVNGKNYFCHDLESVIREEYPNCECAICGIYQKELEQDQIVLFLVKGTQTFVEIRKFGESLRKRIMKRTGLKVDKIVSVSEIPKSSSGKIQRFQLKEYIEKGLYYNLNQQYTRTQIIDMIQEQIEKVLGFTMEDFDESIVEYGMNSMKAASFHKYLTQSFERNLPVSIAYDYPSVNAIANYLLEQEEDVSRKEDKKKASTVQEIAVIGMSCEFPGGVDDVETFWTKLLEGFDAIGDIPEERKELDGYCKRTGLNLKGGFLRDIDQFDPGLFGITPKEAKYLDPQQRLLLKHSYLAMQDACLDAKSLRGSRTGVYVGISNNDYKEIMPKDEMIPYMLSGNINSMAAGRISYTFDFQGPSMVIDTACSSSLVAIHQAILSLRSGESDMALAGGVNCILSPFGYVGLREMNALSPTGRCHTFDDKADGYVRSEGCGVVLLKRLEDAVKDGDHVYAVVKGSAVNSDGWSSGLTAPNGTAQVKVMQLALEDAGINSSNISFIETHGTGTKLGDPQEINALSRVYGGRKDKIVLGAVKTNIGHTESAAGIASFIKTVLAVSKGVIPANPGLNTLNHFIPWSSMNFKVPTEMVSWNQEKRTAAISAFGLSGTNVHMIVEQVETHRKHEISSKTPQILTLSARKKELLKKDMEHCIHLLETSSSSLSSILYSYNRCMANEKYRIAIVAKSRREYIEQLKEKREQDIIGNTRKEDVQKFIMLCGGIHKIDKSILKELYENNDIIKTAIEECDQVLKKRIKEELLPYFHGADPKTKIQEMYIKMAIEYGIYKSVLFFGLKPSAVVGHGAGEWIGAVIAGIMSLEQAFFFATCLEQVKQKYARKRKAAILFIEEKKFDALCQKEKPMDMCIYAINTKENIVVGYEDEQVFSKFVKANTILCMRVPDYEVPWITDKEIAITEFHNMVKEENVSNSTIPYLSTAGGVFECEIDNNHMFFGKQLECVAQIATTLQETEKLECKFYLECNTRPYLSALAEQVLREEKVILPIIRREGQEELQIRDTMAKLYEMGVDIKFTLEKVQEDWFVKLPRRESEQSVYWF